MRSPKNQTGLPVSPTGELMRTLKENKGLQNELHNLKEAFHDINKRNMKLHEEKESMSRRLDEVQSKLHLETEGFNEKSAYAESVAQQLKEEQQKVLKLKRAVDMMERDVSCFEIACFMPGCCLHDTCSGEDKLVPLIL